MIRTAEQFGFREEYAYINPSLDQFPIGTEQVRLAQQAGFSTATHYPIVGGMMGVLVITKGNIAIGNSASNGFLVGCYDNNGQFL